MKSLPELCNESILGPNDFKGLAEVEIKECILNGFIDKQGNPIPVTYYKWDPNVGTLTIHLPNQSNSEIGLDLNGVDLTRVGLKSIYIPQGPSYINIYTDHPLVFRSPLDICTRIPVNLTPRSGRPKTLVKNLSISYSDSMHITASLKAGSKITLYEVHQVTLSGADAIQSVLERNVLFGMTTAVYLIAPDTMSEARIDFNFILPGGLRKTISNWDPEGPDTFKKPDKLYKDFIESMKNYHITNPNKNKNLKKFKIIFSQPSQGLKCAHLEAVIYPGMITGNRELIRGYELYMSIPLSFF